MIKVTIRRYMQNLSCKMQFYDIFAKSLIFWKKYKYNLKTKNRNKRNLTKCN